MATNCDDTFAALPGFLKTHNALYSACVAANKAEGYDSSGQPIPGVQQDSGGGSILGVPLPGSAWWRHFLFRLGEVVIGVAIVVVGIKGIMSGSETTKVVVQGAKTVNKKIGS